MVSINKIFSKCLKSSAFTSLLNPEKNEQIICSYHLILHRSLKNSIIVPRIHALTYIERKKYLEDLRQKFYEITSEIQTDSQMRDFIDPSDFDSALHLAMLCLADAIEGTQSDPQLHFLQAVAHRKVGQLNDALLSAEFAIALLSDEEDLIAAKRSRDIRNQAAVLRAEILNGMGRIEEAEDSLHELLADDLTNRKAAELLEEIVMTKLQEVYEEEKELLEGLDEDSLTVLWSKGKAL